MSVELNSEQLQQLQEKITRLVAEAEEEIAELSQASEPVKLDQQSVGRVSRIDAIQQQQMASTRMRQVAQRKLGLQRAQAAIEQAEYGYCENCDEPIAFARLQFNPAVLRCIKCAD